MATSVFSSLPAPFKLLALTAALGLTATHAHAQGCVAIKQMGGGTCSLEEPAGGLTGKWDLTVSYQHFRSHRHFVGTDQQFRRYAQGSEVINNVDQVDTAISYKVNPATSITLGIPYFSASRTSLYEHDRVNRYEMNASGLGDIRLSTDRWLLDPRTTPKANVSLGLGLKLPTGNSNAKDYAHTTSGLVLRNVDQSIQPGDGALGFTFQLQAFYRLAARTSLYANGFYLVNPKETNGTRTTAAITSVTAYNSVADQYQARLGLSHVILPNHHFTASLGGRLEGVPALDFTGGDRGFRRPGYVFSIEPGLSVARGHDTFSLSVPVAVVRNRVRSYADRLGTGQGDAAFADFLISITYGHAW